MIKKILNNSFLKDTIITFIGQIVVLLTNFVINKMMSVFLDISDFGIFNLAKRFSSVIGFVILIELGISIPRYFAMYKQKNHKKAMEYYLTGFYLMLFLSLATLIVGYFSQEFVSVAVFGNYKHTELSMPIIIYAIGLCWNTFCFSSFRGAEYFILYNVIQIFSQILNIVVIFIFRFKNLGEIITAWGLSNILIVLPLFILFSKLNNFPILFHIQNFKSKLKDLILYGAPRILGEIVQFSYYLLPLIFVNRRFGGYQTGLFSASTGILQAFLPFFSYIGIILLPSVSKAVMNNSLKEVKSQISFLIKLYFLVSFLIVIIGFLFSKPIITLLYSEKYSQNKLIIGILLLTLVPRAQFLLLRNPIDAIAVKPYNTFNLGISMIVMIFVIFLSNNIVLIALSFVISDTVLCCLSFITWQILIRKEDNI
jgi:O-antigen/teichoic acid export membrane protein